MSPEIISGLFGIAGSGLSGLFGHSSSSKALKAQQAENEKNRQHNLYLANLQNKWNMEMYDKNNAYNTPAEQRKRLAQAGLNPDMFYGGNGSLVAAQAPQMTAGEGSHGSVNPAVAPFDAAASVNGMFDNAIKAAQVGLINAQRRKTDAEGSIAISDASVRDAWNRGLFELQGCQIRVADSQANLNDAQIRTITPTINKINAETDSLRQKVEESKAVVANLDADTFYKNVQNVFASDMFKAQLRQFSAQSGLSEAQTKRTLLLMGAELLGIQAQTYEAISRMHLNNAQRGLFDAQTDYQISQNVIASIDASKAQMTFDLRNNGFSSVPGTMNKVLSFTSLLGEFVSGAVPVLSAFK